MLLAGFFFCSSFPILFLKGKAAPGCNLEPRSCLVPSYCEFLLDFIAASLIGTLVAYSSNTSLIIANGLACSRISSLFCSFYIMYYFFLFYFAMSPGEPSIWHLISWIFILPFRGGCGSTYAEVHWGNEKKRRERVGEIKVCHTTPLCESAYQHGERQWRHPPRHKKMLSKCWHYRQCHLFLSGESSRGLCHHPIIVHYWSIYKEAYDFLSSTVKF